MSMEQLKKLVNVKSILSITGALVFIILALRGELTSENVMVILVMIFQSFFGYQNSKQSKVGE
jgi:hypothetical protein